MLEEKSIEGCDTAQDAKIVLSPRFSPHFEERSFPVQVAGEELEE